MLEQKVHTVVMAFYHKVVGGSWSKQGGSRVSDDALLMTHKLIAPLTRVTLARLQLFGRIVLKPLDYV